MNLFYYGYSQGNQMKSIKMYNYVRKFIVPFAVMFALLFLIQYSTIEAPSIDSQELTRTIASSNIQTEKAVSFWKNPYSANISNARSVNEFLSSLEGLVKVYSENNSSFQGIRINDNIPITGNVEIMKHFFDALNQSKNMKVRIADYGDSGHEGDFISGDLRETLQKQFGGNGVGFLSITSQDIAFRLSTFHSFSDNWKTVSVLTGKESKIPYGMNGFVSIPEGSGAWVQYTAGNQFPLSSSFRFVKLYYSNATQSQIKYSFDGGTEKAANLSIGEGLQELILDPKKSAESIKITATNPNQAHFYGVSLEGDNGVYVDNFGWRGNAGISFRDIPLDLKKDFLKYFDYKLIILAFGANIISDGNVNFSWYESQMIKVINELKSAFPNTSILMVGIGDKVIKRGTSFVIHPSVQRMIETQKRIAEITKVAFWNKFEAMGGKNSILDWVNTSPPLAARDYTHLTAEGSKKISQMIAKILVSKSKK